MIAREPLGRYESMFGLQMATGGAMPSLNFTFAVELSRVVSPAELCACMNELIKRHPALRQSIELTGCCAPRLERVTCDPSAPPCDTTILEKPWASSTDLEAAMEDELCYEWTTGTAPMMRVTILTAADRTASCLLFSFCHAQFDGKSAQIVAEECVVLLQGGDLGSSRHCSAPWHLEGICKQAGVTATKDVAAAVTPMMPPWTSYKWLTHYFERFSKVRPSRPAVRPRQVTHGVLTLSLTKEQSAAVLASAKQQGVTVTAWQMAAFTIATTALPNFLSGSGVRLGITYDARAALPEACQGRLGMLFGSGFAYLHPPRTSNGSDDDGFAELCQASAKHLAQVKQGSWQLAAGTVLNSYLPPARIGSLSMKVYPKLLAEKFDKGFVVSNLGKTSFTSHATLQVKRSWLAGCVFPHGCLMLQTTTTNGLMSLALVFAKPALSKEDVGIVRDALLARIGSYTYR
jgi:hypothetical protein